MEKLLTTKDLSRAIGVSESSLRRWANDGVIHTARTAGGHRRISLSEAIRFIRRSGASVIDPAALGLVDVKPLAAASGAPIALTERLYEILSAGDLPRFRAQIVGLYLGGVSIASIADGPLRIAMERIGAQWKEDPRAILLEHRATEICIHAIGRLRELIPPAPEKSPLAVGAAPEGDPYILPSAVAAAVLAEEGWRELNFGADTPVKLLATVAAERKASLAWISISAKPSPALRREIKRLAEKLTDLKIPLAIGGRMSGDLEIGRLPNVHLLGSMAELSALAQGIAPRS